MRSKTSFFNGTLFRKNLGRFWPLWGLASFGASLLPLTALMQMLRLDMKLTELQVTSAYYVALSSIVPVVSLAYAILCGMMVWSYLDNPRSVGMLHRLPIRREGLFITTFLSGMAMMLIPYVIAGALTVLVTVLGGAAAPKALLTLVLGVLGESFFYFSTATLAAFLTGNVFAMPVLYFLLHFLQPLVSALLTMLQSGFYVGVPGSYSQVGQWLSPTLYLMNRVQAESRYEEVTNAQGFTEHMQTGIELENIHLIGAYALVGLALLVLAFLLYRCRASERAGDVAGAGWMRPVFRYLGALLLGVGGGMLLYAVVWRPMQGYDELFSAVPLAVCMVVMGLIGYFGVSMLLEKTLRVFRAGVPGAIAAAALLILLCGAMSMDVFHVESRVPDRSELETVSLWVNGDQYILRSDSEDALVEKALGLHQTIVDELDYIKSGYPGGEPNGHMHLEMNYHLTNGQTLRRVYSLELDQSRMNRPGTYERMLDAFFNETPEMRVLRISPEAGMHFTGGRVETWDNELRGELTAGQTEAVAAAIAQDARNGSWGKIDWFGTEAADIFPDTEMAADTAVPEEGEEPTLLAYLFLSYEIQGREDEGQQELYICLRPRMKETLACLRQLGLMEKDSFRLISNLVGEEGAAPAAAGIPVEVTR